jgi:site-specific DNA-methyltransferase (adenine-specific)
MRIEQIGNCTLYLGDCLEILPEIGKVDAVVTDPPYGTTVCSWDTVIPFDRMWACIDKVTKPAACIALFGNEPFSSYLRISNIQDYKYDWIWLKNLSGGFITAKKMPMGYSENISIFYMIQPTYNPIMRNYSDSVYKRFKQLEKTNSSKAIKNNKKNNIQKIKKQDCVFDFNIGAYPKREIYFKSVHNANNTRVHPSQKPVLLLEYLVKTYTDERDTVLDFTMGSGSTGVACVNTNRKFIGIEINEKYFDIACKRIELAAAQGILDFGGTK